MERTMAALQEHTKLIRHRGGFWLAPGDELDGDGMPGNETKWYHGTTMEALARRGLVECTDEKIGYGGNPYPSEYSLIQ